MAKTQWHKVTNLYSKGSNPRDWVPTLSRHVLPRTPRHSPLHPTLRPQFWCLVMVRSFYSIMRNLLPLSRYHDRQKHQYSLLKIIVWAVILISILYLLLRGTLSSSRYPWLPILLQVRKVRPRSGRDFLSVSKCLRQYQWLWCNSIAASYVHGICN